MNPLTHSLVDVFEQFERLQIGRARSLPSVDVATLRLAFEKYFAERKLLPMRPNPPRGHHPRLIRGRKL